jgi:dipeptidyl aminopeptidase/acylaminoacyl peptidase
VDPARIGIFGASYGGYLTMLALARNSRPLRGRATECGIYDMSTNPRGTSRGGEPGRIARESSAWVGSIDKWRSPVLIIHGDDDPGVDFDQQTIGLVKALRAERALRAAGFPTRGTDPPRGRHALQARQATADFFDRHLAGVGLAFRK